MISSVNVEDRIGAGSGSRSERDRRAHSCPPIPGLELT